MAVAQELPIIHQAESIFVSANLLHKKLKVQSIFANWIKRRIGEYGFNQGQDFFPNLEKSSGGRRSTDYLLTLDMAKELAMVERNEVGRNIRRYFIEKEKELRGMLHLPAASLLFKGLKPRIINDRRMYNFVSIRQRCGYSTRSSSSYYRHRYWQHFIKDGQVLYCTEELCLQLHQQKQVAQNRVKLREMQPVLPLDFGTSSLTLKPLSHAN